MTYVTHGLTLIQPWGTAILELGKDVENRDWRPPNDLLGGRIALHAGKKVDRALVDALLGGKEVQTGAIIGTVELVGCIRLWPGGRRVAYGLDEAQIVAAYKSRWRNPDSSCLWYLREPQALREPIPYPGALGLWKVPESVSTRIAERLDG